MNEWIVAVCNLLGFFLSVWIELITIALYSLTSLLCVIGNCGMVLGELVDKPASNHSCGLWDPRGKTGPADNGVFCLTSPSYFLFLFVKIYIYILGKQVSFYFV